jgi:hypothetical protein
MIFEHLAYPHAFLAITINDNKDGEYVEINRVKSSFLRLWEMVFNKFHYIYDDEAPLINQFKYKL